MESTIYETECNPKTILFDPSDFFVIFNHEEEKFLPEFEEFMHIGKWEKRIIYNLESKIKDCIQKTHLNLFFYKIFVSNERWTLRDHPTEGVHPICVPVNHIITFNYFLNLFVANINNFNMCSFRPKKLNINSENHSDNLETKHSEFLLLKLLILMIYLKYLLY